MGPTGAGKSTFIESLGLKGEHRISSNQLDGFTQTVSTYEVKNAKYKGNKIFLVDSPGFADPKISDMEIVTMLQDWIPTNGGFYFSCILYLTPITHIRLPGSQRQVLKTFEALTGVKAVRHITVVTTMWDCIWSDSVRRRADATFEQLRSDIWKVIFCSY
ncbi:P-loop containing nucleoside triphosphate hydrolase protein [Panaeolus papilionaceus]|nr:P-loop containing nucleoside triphosphate hydrolase protein [Panaeolus papilionaceus]